MNSFLKAANEGSAYTKNGALSYSTSGSMLVDQYGKAGTYLGRKLSDVFADQSAIWGENELFALRFPFYLRMVSRKVKDYNSSSTEKVQKGQGLKDESFKRMLWIAKYHPEHFYKNLWVLPLVGSWKDLWVLLSMDDTLDKKEFFKVIQMGIESESQIDLVKKYLPRNRSSKKAITEWSKKTNMLAKEFCKYAGWNAKMYRIFKSTGVAHKFQQIISDKRYDEINWNAIPGKALFKLVNSSKGKESFLKRHNLEENYLEWIKKQPVAKFTGYVYELGHKIDKVIYNLSLVDKLTIDRQFDGLIELAKKDEGCGIKGNVWCALDTSGSMTGRINYNSDITAYDVCISLGIYFSTLNEGAFHKNVIMFDSVSNIKELKGTFSDMWMQIKKSNTAWGSTNFQSVIDEIVRVRLNNKDIPLEDYPQTLLVVSDMQFNPCGKDTNYEASKKKLLMAFPKEFVDNFKFIWWNVNGSYGNDMPSTLDDGGTYFFSGFDGSIISLLLGGDNYVDPKTGEKKQPNMEEMLQMSLTQEVLENIVL